MRKLAPFLPILALAALVLVGATAAPSAAHGQVAGKVVDVSEAPAKGSDSARLAVIEFSDYQCPYCSRSVTDFFPLLNERYVETGKVRYVFMDFPLDTHRHAFKAAVAARCAGDQGAFWEMHDHLFQRQREIQPAAFKGFAEELGLDVDRFEGCMAGSSHEAGIKADVAQGKASGVNGTPIFLIGTYNGETGSVTVKQQMRGVKPFPMVEKMLDPLLADSASE